MSDFFGKPYFVSTVRPSAIARTALTRTAHRTVRMTSQKPLCWLSLFLSVNLPFVKCVYTVFIFTNRKVKISDSHLLLPCQSQQYHTQLITSGAACQGKRGKAHAKEGGASDPCLVKSSKIIMDSCSVMRKQTTLLHYKIQEQAALLGLFVWFSLVKIWKKDWLWW